MMPAPLAAGILAASLAKRTSERRIISRRLPAITMISTWRAQALGRGMPL